MYLTHGKVASLNCFSSNFSRFSHLPKSYNGIMNTSTKNLSYIASAIITSLFLVKKDNFKNIFEIVAMFQADGIINIVKCLLDLI